MKRLDEVMAQIDSYFANGGLFNPEFMDHDKVRDLMLACRDLLATIPRLVSFVEAQRCLCVEYGPLGEVYKLDHKCPRCALLEEVLKS